MEETRVISLFCVCVSARACCACVHFLVMPDMARHVSRGLTSCLGPRQKNLC